jgi:DNA helicase-2/ATP-dependent DNA helicase PcrA
MVDEYQDTNKIQAEILYLLTGSDKNIKEEDLEEELRLMYVAATRTRENLFFTYPNQVYDRTLSIVLNRPSRFIDMTTESILENQSAGY